MVKKKPGSFKKLRQVGHTGPGPLPVPAKTSSTDSTSFFTWKRFTLVFIIGFAIALVPDIIEIQRHIYEDMNKDLDPSETQNLTKLSWYSIDTDALPSQMGTKYIQLGEDAMTQQFLINSTRKSRVLFREVFHSLFSAALRPFMTRTSINGLLGRSKMFVYSDEQFSLLVGKDGAWKENSLLDIGAGDGTVTQVMAPHFEHTWVTETSSTMSWALRRKGFRISDAQSWPSEHNLHDVVTCLNVLNRTDRPITMLKNMRKVLYPGGIVIVSVTLPLQQYYEYGNTRGEERLDLSGVTFEEQMESLVNDILRPLSYHLIRFTKLPYLAEGDRSQPFYKLEDAVFVLSVM